MRKKIVLSLAIGWTFLILVLCLVSFSDLPKVKVSAIDKYVHFTLHLVFTGLWGYYSWLSRNSIIVGKMVFIVLSSILFGGLIEILQETCTKSRHADTLDVLANFTGAATAFLVFIILKKIRKV